MDTIEKIHNREYFDSQVHIKHSLEYLVHELSAYVIPAIKDEIDKDKPDSVRLRASRMVAHALLMDTLKELKQ